MMRLEDYYPFLFGARQIFRRKLLVKLPVWVHLVWWFFKTTWWFQPIWKLLVQMGIFPKDRGENKKKWNHHLDKFALKKVPKTRNLSRCWGGKTTNLYHQPLGTREKKPGRKLRVPKRHRSSPQFNSEVFRSEKVDRNTTNPNFNGVMLGCPWKWS